MVLAFKVWAYASSLPPDAPWPNTNFRTCLLCISWFLVPFISGLVSRTCDPHHRFIAAFEGISASILFSVIAKDFPF